MKQIRTPTAVMIVLALALSAASAQDEREPPPGGTGGTVGPTGKRVPKSDVPVSVPLADLEVEKVPEVLEAIRTLRHEAFACTACDVRAPRAGACPRCEEPLAKEADVEVVAQVKITTDRQQVSITLRPHHWITLSEIDAILRERGAHVERDAFRLPTYARFAVTGLGDSSAQRLRSALIDRKVFESVSVVADPGGERVWAQPRAEEGEVEPVTVGMIQATLSEMRGEVRIADVEWAAYCPDCRQEPSLRTIDTTCRRPAGGREGDRAP